ncbi:hypothetical protein PIB30_070090 [Stylosanthes scabra]|uniref:Replication factor-A protein 1 N-terminal domain-containing protein n=1 Tax=Stylosanthes scabra TaxID=79078 RepID=A0ABU6QPG0_9FABA|nr:hypothetical protein [Stylosanthes scabra]
MAGVQLTPSAITTICGNDFSLLQNLRPVLQVIDVKPLSSPETRYRLMLSDGSHYHQSMLTIMNNHLLVSGILQTGSIILLTNFTCPVVQNRPIIIIIDLDVILEKCNLIGTPVSVKFGGSYANQNMGFCNPESQASGPFQDSYIHQPQSMHQPPMKMPEAKENFTPSSLDIQAVLKRCETVEKEVQSLKDSLSLINRKDSEQRKQIEDLRKQNAELAGEKERLLQAIQGILSEN